MTEAEKFTPTEWQTLQFAPFWAFGQVAGIDGKIDEDETKAFIKALSEAPVYKSPLVREVLMSIANDAGAIMAAYTADPRKVAEGLPQVSDLLAAKVDATEALMFKGALVGIVMDVAKASGSLFGNKVSKDEQTAIAFVAALLRFDPAEFSRVAPTYAMH